MTSEEFWKDDPQLFASYRTSFVNKEKREMNKADYICWLQGLYIHDGNGKLFSSLKQFIGNLVAGLFKGTKDNTEIGTYPKKPYNELAEDEQRKNKEEIKKQNYKEFEDSLIYFGTLKQQFLNKMKNGRRVK